MVLRPGF